jgi:hypothetical protein
MTRKIISLLILCGGGALLLAPALPAQSGAGSTASTPSLPDDTLYRYLTQPQRDQWDAAKQSISDANDKIQNGNFLLSRQLDPTSSIDTGVAQAHIDGKKMVTDGNAAIKAANKILAALRIQALANYNNVHQAAQAEAGAIYSTATTQWPDAAQDMSDKVLNALWTQGYQRIYLAGIYAYATPKYALKADLTSRVSQNLASTDADKKTFVANHDWTFHLGQDGSSLIIDYPDRAAVQQGGVKAAMIVGELLVEPVTGYAAYSLRAVDLSNWHIVANETRMLSVEPTLGKLLGLPAYRVPSMRILPAAAAPALAANATAAPAAAPTGSSGSVTVSLQDPNGIFLGFKQAARPYIFRVADGTNTIENRFATLAFKAYLSSQTSLIVTDYDFLRLALTPESGVDLTSPGAGAANVAWLLGNVADFSSPTLDLVLQAENLASKADVNVGKIEIQRTLPKLSAPSVEDLKAGGYSIN